MAGVTSFLEMLQPLQSLPRLQSAPDSLCLEEDETTAEQEAAQQETQTLVNDILAQAHQEAATLLEDARVQADTLREAAWQEGFHDGQTTGRCALEMTLRDEWQEDKTALRTQVQELIAGIVTARQALWDRQEAEMVAFVLTIARQVIKTEVTQNPEIVRHVIQNALRRVTDKENVRIRVSMNDASRVRAMRDDLLAITDGLRHLEIVDDRRVGDGGCVIETNAGTVDAKIETQLAEVERAVTPDILVTPTETEETNE